MSLNSFYYFRLLTKTVDSEVHGVPIAPMFWKEVSKPEQVNPNLSANSDTTGDFSYKENKFYYNLSVFCIILSFDSVYLIHKRVHRNDQVSAIL